MTCRRPPFCSVLIPDRIRRPPQRPPWSVSRYPPNRKCGDYIYWILVCGARSDITYQLSRVPWCLVRYLDSFYFHSRQPYTFGAIFNVASSVAWRCAVRGWRGAHAMENRREENSSVNTAAVRKVHTNNRWQLYKSYIPYNMYHVRLRLTACLRQLHVYRCLLKQWPTIRSNVIDESLFPCRLC